MIMKHLIPVTLYLRPIFYEDSEILSSYIPDNKAHSTSNPSRIVGGPLTGMGEELENPIGEEIQAFIEDCIWLVKEVGFVILSHDIREDLEKTVHIIGFGFNGEPLGSVLFNLKVSAQPFPKGFPTEAEDKAMQYLKIGRILDGTARTAGIVFQVDKVIVASYEAECWLDAVMNVLDKLFSIQNQLQEDGA